MPRQSGQTGRLREFTVRVMQDKLAAHAEEDVGHAKSDRKFNIRVKQDDVCLLDALAKTHGVTRSTLINQILHDILRDELMSIEEGDARVLLAHVADLSASYDDLSLPWVYDALASHSLVDMAPVEHERFRWTEAAEIRPSEAEWRPSNLRVGEEFEAFLSSGKV